MSIETICLATHYCISRKGILFVKIEITNLAIDSKIGIGVKRTYLNFQVCTLFNYQDKGILNFFLNTETLFSNISSFKHAELKAVPEIYAK